MHYVFVVSSVYVILYATLVPPESTITNYVSNTERCVGCGYLNHLVVL